MKVLILLLWLASGRGMPLEKNGALFQKQAEQWSRDNDLPSINEARLAFKHFPYEGKVPFTFKHPSAENESPLAFNHFSDENEVSVPFNRFSDEDEAPGTFKRFFPENEALLARPLDGIEASLTSKRRLDENNAPLAFKHLFDENEAPLKSFYSELISGTLYSEKYNEIIINSGANLREYNIKYNKPDFAVYDQEFNDYEYDDNDDDDDDNYDNYYNENCDENDRDVIYDDYFTEDW